MKTILKENMLELRLLCDDDIPLIENWLNKQHVKRWYEIPAMGITIDDWMSEIKEYQGEFRWITYLIVQCQGKPIGLCLYYKCTDSDEDFGNLSLDGAYGIDYLIGEETYLGKGLGRKMVQMLVDQISSFQDAKIVTADIDIENMASGGTLRSCGFTLLEQGSGRYIKKIGNMFN